MTSQDIRQAIIDFLNLIEHGRGTEDDTIRALVFALDRVAFAAHFVHYTFEDMHPDPPAQDYQHVRTLVGHQFPSFGYYNLPCTITENIANTEVGVGDAIDDLADIARDLSDILWCWTHTSENDGLWHFQFSYESHICTHLRNLQWYVQAFKDER